MATSITTPPVPPSTAAVTATASAVDGGVNENIARRRAQMDSRKHDLLIEARAARMEWILHAATANRDADVGVETQNNSLSDLQACSEGILPSALQIIDVMMPKSDKSETLRRIMNEQSLSWDSVGAHSDRTSGAAVGAINQRNPTDTGAAGGGDDDGHYNTFLQILCEPASADLVMSLQKFCKTIEEASNVMVTAMQEGGDDGGDINNDITGSSQESWGNTKPSSDSTIKSVDADEERIDHGATLAKAIRGFIKTTTREMEDHESFHDYLYPRRENGDITPLSNGAAAETSTAIDSAAKEQLSFSLEQFVYKKCRPYIDMVLLAEKEKITNTNSAKTMKELQSEIHAKMQSLQFVSPAHLEISCLKNGSDVDFSYAMGQLRSILDQSSPRQILHTIRLAHQGVSKALAEAGGPSSTGEGNHGKNLPGADDVLPALILATLRAHPPTLPMALRFIEAFASPLLLRGEAGYAYTNMCGAMQFIVELDVQSHLAEVMALEEGIKGASLLISPEEMKAGLDASRRKIMKKKDELLEEQEKMNAKDDAHSREREEFVFVDAVDKDDAASFNINISARQVREARLHGESVDLDWAIERRNKSTWQEGRVRDVSKPSPANDDGDGQHLPPEEPPIPPQFTRSYNFLTTPAENISLRDLPRLLNEYKMLVHTTEVLLNERMVWRESERKRQMKLQRETLEQNFLNVVGNGDGCDAVVPSNGR